MTAVISARQALEMLPASNPAHGQIATGRILDLERIRVFETLSQATGTDVVAELVGVFLVALPERLAELASSLEAGELRQIEFLAHRLKGSSSNLGALALVEISSQLERQAQLRQLGSCQALWQPLCEAAAATEHALRGLTAASG